MPDPLQGPPAPTGTTRACKRCGLRVLRPSRSPAACSGVDPVLSSSCAVPSTSSPLKAHDAETAFTNLANFRILDLLPTLVAVMLVVVATTNWVALESARSDRLML